MPDARSTYVVELRLQTTQFNAALAALHQKLNVSALPTLRGTPEQIGSQVGELRSVIAHQEAAANRLYNPTSPKIKTAERRRAQEFVESSYDIPKAVTKDPRYAEAVIRSQTDTTRSLNRVAQERGAYNENALRDLQLLRAASQEATGAELQTLKLVQTTSLKNLKLNEEGEARGSLSSRGAGESQQTLARAQKSFYDRELAQYQVAASSLGGVQQSLTPAQGRGQALNSTTRFNEQAAAAERVARAAELETYGIRASNAATQKGVLLGGVASGKQLATSTAGFDSSVAKAAAAARAAELQHYQVRVSNAYTQKEGLISNSLAEKQALASRVAFNAQAVKDDKIAVAEESKAARARVLAARQSYGQPQGTFSRFINTVRGGPGAATGQQGAAAFFGSGLAGVARYALPSAAAFGTARAISGSIKEASELERQFTLIRGQFDATFGSEGKAKFQAFRAEILGVARDTGLAASEVANIGFQLQGAFGKGVEIGGVSGSELVGDQLRASAEISRVTGLSQKEVVDSLTAASLNFNASFREIGDTTLFLQDRFGVLAKEIIPFLGDIAPVAREAGFSLKEFASIAAITQQQSGRSGAALAEAFGRVLPQINEQRLALVQFASRTPQLNTPDIVQTFAAGSVRDIFIELAEIFPKLDQSSRDFLLNLIGGRRETQSIIAALAGGKLDETIGSLSGSAGTLDKRFKEVSKSLQEVLARAQETFRQLGVAVFEGGLGDALKELATLLALLAKALIGVANVVGEIDQAFGGFGIEIALAAVAMTKLVKIYKEFMALRAAGALSGGIAGFSLTGSGTSARQTAANINAPIVATAAPLTGRTPNVGNKGGITLGGIGTTLGILAATQVYSYYKNKEAQDKADFEEGYKKELERLQGKSTEELAQADRAPIDPSAPGGAKEAVRRLSEKDSDKKYTTDEQGRVWSTEERALFTAYNKRLVEEQYSAIINAITADPQALIDSIKADPSTLNALRTATTSGEAPYRLPKQLDSVDALKGVPAKALAGDKDALAFLAKLKPYSGNIGALTQAQNKVDLTVATAQSEKRAVDLAALQESYNAGEIGLAQFLTQLDAQIKAETLAVDFITSRGGDASKEIKALSSDIKLKNATYSKQLDNYTDLAQELRDLGGELGSGTQAGVGVSISSELGKLQDPQYADKGAQLATAKKLVGLLQKQREIEANAASTLEERNRILAEERPLPEVIGRILAAGLIDLTPAWSAFTQLLAGAYVGITEDAIKNLAVAVLLKQQTEEQAIAVLKAAEAKIANVINSIGDIGLLESGGVINEYTAAIKQSEGISALLENLRPSKINLGSYTGDIGKIQSGGAADEGEDLVKKAEEAQKAYLEAMNDYMKALIEGDLVKIGQHAVAEAQFAIDVARDEAEKLNGEAAKIRAQRGLDDALRDLADSRIDILLAQAEVAGDTIEIAKLEQQKANDALARSQADYATGGGGEAAVNRATAEKLKADANVVTTQIDTQREDAQFAHDMGKLTKQQFLSLLTNLRNTVGIPVKLQRDLDRQIKDLQGSLKSDLQFNLPTFLKLPTLYQARRIDQSGGGESGVNSQAGGSSAGYNDNRNVSVVLYVNNGTDQAQMLQLLSDVIGTNRVSFANRRY